MGRVVRDWSNAMLLLNSVLVNPFVPYGVMDEFQRLLSPGAFMGAFVGRIASCVGWWPRRAEAFAE